MQSLQSSNSAKEHRIDRWFNPAVVWILRILVGAVFIVSGFAKSIDPWGSFYKITEYLDVWGWDVPSSIRVISAVSLGGFEFVTGFLLLLGSYRRSVVWLLLLTMAFMLPLALYIAVFDPVADCGCFGDFIVISNTATFLKNVIITIMHVYLVLFNRKVGGLYMPYVQWIIGGLLSLYILIVALYGYNIQPLIDFRRFSPGTELLGPNTTYDETVDTDTDSGDGSNVESYDDYDEAEYEFVYEKNGSREIFTLDNLPDSTWTFVDRRLIAGTESTVGIDGFGIIVDGEDIASEIIDTEADQFIVTIPDLRAVDLSYTYILNELNEFITSRGGSMVALVNADADGIGWWRDVSMASYPIYSAEPTLIKELARGRAALVYLHEGKVEWKRTLSSISYTFLTETAPDELTQRLDPAVSYMLNIFTLTFAGLLLIIMILDRSGKLVAWLIKRKRRKADSLNRCDTPAACNRVLSDDADSDVTDKV